MIHHLRGVLAEKHPTEVVIDVGGVGMRVEVPVSTSADLPAGGEVFLHTVLQVREEEVHLYGFATTREREAFRHLVRVTGIGARIALAVLSGASVSELARAIRSKDLGWLRRIKGVGPKTAQRILVELSDAPVWEREEGEVPEGREPVLAGDVIDALLSLGYDAGTARRLAERALTEAKEEAGGSPSELVRLALRLDRK